jgi:hypothetical protein
MSKIQNKKLALMEILNYFHSRRELKTSRVYFFIHCSITLTLLPDKIFKRFFFYLFKNQVSTVCLNGNPRSNHHDSVLLVFLQLNTGTVSAIGLPYPHPFQIQSHNYYSLYSAVEARQKVITMKAHIQYMSLLRT